MWFIPLNDTISCNTSRNETRHHQGAFHSRISIVEFENVKQKKLNTAMNQAELHDVNDATWTTTTIELAVYSKI